MVEAIEYGHSEIKKICAVINQLRDKVGKPKRTVTPPEFDQKIIANDSSKVGDATGGRPRHREVSQGGKLREWSRN